MADRLIVKAPPPKPLLVYDGECGFCRYWVARWCHRSGDGVEYRPYQDADLARCFPEMDPRRYAKAVQLIGSDGRVSEGAEAVFGLLAIDGARWPMRVYERVPGVAAIAESVYRVIAAHRTAASRVTRLFWGRDPRPSTYALATWWFLRLIGVAYLAAFWSLGTQIAGLIGRDGIVSAGVGDAWLQGVCVVGAVLASLLVGGFAPLLVLPLLWAGYAWLSTIAHPFLSFQWDTLLLEAGLLSIWIAPAVWRDRLRGAADPPRLGVWLMLWLLFRLMFGSGGVKLSSGDPTWRDLTALTVHYETQPIPTPVAWWAHHLPVWFNEASTAAVLGIELVASLFMLGPRRLRMFACVLLAALQLLIALTGNYAFFNLLSLALCLFLLDDAVLSRASRPPVEDDRPPRRTGALERFRRVALVAVAIVVVPVSALHFAAGVGVPMPGSAIVLPLARLVSPLRSVNSYGLFAVMTTTRDEIVVEGSDDGSRWLEYEFPYKPGDLQRRPPWVAPHQPRLDWQMWFAALDRFDDQPWFQAFCVRLLEGSPPVLRLLARDPFQGHPPRYIRGLLYRYHFSDADARRRGIWWTREQIGAYMPPLSLRR